MATAEEIKARAREIMAQDLPEDYNPELGDDEPLIVEGGAQTHRAFLDADIWDELRVETSPMEITDGTRAVAIPANAVMTGEQRYDGNIIRHYTKA